MSKDIMKKSRVLPANFGPLKDASANARITGPCGDTMEMWISFDNGKVNYASFTTDGCVHSIICGSTAAAMIVGMSEEEVETVQAEEVLARVIEIPDESSHCALLAVNTIKKAVGIMKSEREKPVESSCDSSSCFTQLPLENIKHKVVVLSGKGGVGKSTFAVNMATAVAAAGYKTGLLDVDFHGPSIPVMMGITDASVESGANGILPVEKGNLKIISIGSMLKNSDDAIIWRGPMKMGIIQQFLRDVDWGELDYLFIDCPPGTGDEPLSLCQLLKDPDGAVIVTTPQEVASADVRKSVNFCSQLNLPVLGIVENMSGFVCPGCGEVTDIFSSGGGKKIATDYSVPFLGSVPLDPAVGIAGDEGTPYIQKHPRGVVAEKMRDIIRPLLKLEEEAESGTESSEKSSNKGDLVMRIAVPVSGGKLNMHFGHCDKFALIDVDKDGKEIKSREDVDAPPHEPGLLPQWLAERNVNTVIAGGMGQRAQSLFENNNISVIVGAPSEKPEALVMSYLEGTLKTGSNICDH